MNLLSGYGSQCTVASQNHYAQKTRRSSCLLCRDVLARHSHALTSHSQSRPKVPRLWKLCAGKVGMALGPGWPVTVRVYGHVQGLRGEHYIRLDMTDSW